MENIDMEKMMEEIEREATEEMDRMKSVISNKTECMIDSYSSVLNKTEKMFQRVGMYNLEQVEVVKRADMFWNIAFNKVVKDREDEIRNAERREIEARKNISTQNKNMSNTISQEQMEVMMKSQNSGNPPVKSPCQEKAEREHKLKFEEEVSKAVEAKLKQIEKK